MTPLAGQPSASSCLYAATNALPIILLSLHADSVFAVCLHRVQAAPEIHDVCCVRPCALLSHDEKKNERQHAHAFPDLFGVVQVAPFLKLCYSRLVDLAPLLTQRVGGEQLLISTVLCDSLETSCDDESSEDEVGAV
eukprot:1159627-Pelagomonas_calceolata.AAC.4